MDKKGGIATAFYRAGIKKTPELTIPKKEFDTRYARTPKHHLFGMHINLLVKAPYFGHDK